ncbi:MAG TPA: molybdopterin-dependent oxidoreductase [Vicinamibacterales bacterium]|nr:molybdopterin-dependent oxidoreductase [Vicinamibacterales bacterium]
MTRPPETWGRSTVHTACPLDCPDSCSLAVDVERGKIVSIDGSRVAPSTNGFICGKVRRFDRRVYGEDRLLYPAVRSGGKGEGSFRRVDWTEALDLVAERFGAIAREHGGEAILPVSYGGSNGWLSHDATDRLLFRSIGASELARTVCAAPTGAAAMAMYGKMAGVAYEDYQAANLIVVWGCNPAVTGVHLVPHIKEAQKRGATLVVIDPRMTPLARQADVHLALRPGSDLPVALALHRYLFEQHGAHTAFLEMHAHGVAELRAASAPWTFERAAETAGVGAAALEQVARLYAEASPAVIRCGWGLERNRNGGSAVLAVLALPAVGGKFGVPGGGYTMSNSAAFGARPLPWDAPTSTRVVNMNRVGRALAGQDPGFAERPIKGLFVYNCNPLATLPDQNRMRAGLEREDLFTVVFEQVMTDTARFADVILPATTFLEHYDLARGYGAYHMHLVQPAIEPVGEARPNVEVFHELLQRMRPEAAQDGAFEETDALLQMQAAIGEDRLASMYEDGVAAPPFGGRPVQFATAFPQTPDGKIHLHPASLAAETGGALYQFRPDPATSTSPLALISPATEKTVSSTLGELSTKIATLLIHPDDARARGIQSRDSVKVFNGLGEVHCEADVTPETCAGTVILPKGLWMRNTWNQQTANALAPDTLTDIAGGACFNDARVDVALLARH